MTTKPPRTFDAAGSEEKAAPVNLSSLERVRLEMAKVYRDARAGKIETADATKLTFILAEIGKLHRYEAEAKTDTPAPTMPSLDVSKLSIETQLEIVRARRGT